MTSFLPTLAVSVLGPLCALIGIRIAWLNMRDTRVRERAVSCHERAATARFDEGAHAFLYARSLLALAERAEDPVDRDQLVAPARGQARCMPRRATEQPAVGQAARRVAVVARRGWFELRCRRLPRELDGAEKDEAVDNHVASASTSATT